jgi:hypothetical protein
LSFMISSCPFWFLFKLNLLVRKDSWLDFDSPFSWIWWASVEWIVLKICIVEPVLTQEHHFF